MTTTSKQARTLQTLDLFATVEFRNTIARVHFACLSEQWNNPQWHVFIDGQGRRGLDCTAEELTTQLTDLVPDICEQYIARRSPATIILGSYRIERINPGIFAVRATYDNPYQVARDRFLSGHS